MSKSSRAKRRAENIAKQEQLKREREQARESADDDVTIATTGIQDAPVASNADEVAHQKRNGEQGNSPPSTRAERIIAACTVFIALLALVQAVCLGIQNRNISKQIRQTDQNLDMMRLDRSASISIMPPRLSKFGPGEYSEFVFGLNNSGKTRAKVTTLRYTPFFADADENLTKYLDSWGPNAGHRQGMIVTTDIACQVQYQLKELFSTAEIEHVKDRTVIHPNMGERRLYFVVDCIYTDGVDADGHTRDVFYYVPDAENSELLRIDPRYGINELGLRKDASAKNGD